MIEIDILTIECIDGVLSFNYTLDGIEYSYEAESGQNSWTIEELESLVTV